MNRLCVFALGIGIGAWTVPIAQRIADRLAGRHFLSIQIEESR